MATAELARHMKFPSYPEMITEAIEVIGAGEGSNRESISAYIAAQYPFLPNAHPVFVEVNLNRMTDSGELVLRNNNYMLKAKPVEPPRRGRGRPPKPKNPAQPEATPSSSRKPRGRPPKKREDGTQKNAAASPPKPSSTVKAKAVGGGKPRGRPRKTEKPTGSVREPKEGARRSESIQLLREKSKAQLTEASDE